MCFVHILMILLHSEYSDHLRLVPKGSIVNGYFIPLTVLKQCVLLVYKILIIVKHDMVTLSS
jgi:hypothetical protein